MNENYLTWDEYENLDADSIPRWVDVHSVTCALCGQLADERQTRSLWDDETTPSPESGSLDYSEYPEGEAHPSCVEQAEAGEKPKSGWTDE